MRKIETEQIREKRSQTTKLFLGLVLIALLLFSTAGYAFYGVSNSNAEPEQDYNGLYWTITKSYSTLYLLTEPVKLDTSGVTLVGNAMDYNGQPLFIDSLDPAINEHLALNLQSYFNSIQEACYGSCERDIPEKDCTQPIIIYKDSTDRIIRQEQQCFFIDGDQEAVDSFLMAFVP